MKLENNEQKETISKMFLGSLPFLKQFLFQNALYNYC